MDKRRLERILINELEDQTLEEFLEQFNIEAIDVVTLLFEEGMLDEDILERLDPID